MTRDKCRAHSRTPTECARHVSRSWAGNEMSGPSSAKKFIGETAKKPRTRRRHGGRCHHDHLRPPTPPSATDPSPAMHGPSSRPAAASKSPDHSSLTACTLTSRLLDYVRTADRLCDEYFVDGTRSEDSEGGFVSVPDRMHGFSSRQGRGETWKLSECLLRARAVATTWRPRVQKALHMWSSMSVSEQSSTPFIAIYQHPTTPGQGTACSAATEL